MIPFDILLERLKQYDEVQLCELLDISAEDLVDGFVAKIKERRAYITKEIELIDPEDIGADDLDFD